MTEWKQPSSAELLRPHPLQRVVQPFRERDFTFDAYSGFLDRLGASHACVVPLREFRGVPREGPVVALRHDVDERLDAALQLAELEHERGLAATYFVLHSAPYWRDPELIPKLLRLQELGHEVGWHNDLVSLELVERIDPVEYLRRELARLREAGVDIVGTAAHGSIWCHRLGFGNNAFFTDFPEARQPDVPISRAAIADFGFEYEAYHLGEEHYYSDSRFDSRGRRWHPEFLDVDTLRPGEGTIVLVHPCHWDRSRAAKVARVARKAGGRFPRRRA